MLFSRLTHDPTSSHPSLVQRARVDHGRGVGFGTKNDEKVAHHGRFFVLIQVDDVLRTELFKCEFNHTNSTVNNLSARSNHGAGLLPTKHRLSDFSGVGKVADTSFEHGDART